MGRTKRHFLPDAEIAEEIKKEKGLTRPYAPGEA